MKNKLIISAILLVGVFLLVSAIIFQEQKVAVLGYHSFATTDQISNMTQKDNMIMDISNFEEQLKYLKKNNYKTLTLDEFYDYQQGKCKIPRKSVLITMDDGYKSNYYLAFPLLKKYNMQAVVFVIGENVLSDNDNYMNLDIIEKAKTEYPNITFASHSFGLHEQGAIDREIEYIEEDFKKMEKIIPTKYFAYPYGAYNEQAISVLKENSYKLAFGFGPGKEHRKSTKKDDSYKIPRLNISNDMPLWKFKLRLILPF